MVGLTHITGGASAPPRWHPATPAGGHFPLLSSERSEEDRRGGGWRRRRNYPPNYPTKDTNMDTNFAQAEMRLRSKRASVDKRIMRAEWRAANDPLADLGTLGSLIDTLTAKANLLTQRIAAHEDGTERRALRAELMS